MREGSARRVRGAAKAICDVLYRLSGRSVGLYGRSRRRRARGQRHDFKPVVRHEPRCHVRHAREVAAYETTGELPRAPAAKSAAKRGIRQLIRRAR
jgi:hypothetical protein